jgi:hypothetical protein
MQHLERSIGVGAPVHRERELVGSGRDREVRPCGRRRRLHPRSAPPPAHGRAQIGREPVDGSGLRRLVLGARARKREERARGEARDNPRANGVRRSPSRGAGAWRRGFTHLTRLAFFLYTRFEFSASEDLGMNEPQFDPGAFYEFNLAQGAVRVRDGSRVIILSDNVLAPLVSVAVKDGDLKPVRRLGRQLGEMIQESLGGSATNLPPELVVGHAAGVLALFGWGKLTMERWGDAIVARLSQLPLLDDGSLGIAALLGGVFTELFGDEVACVPIGSEMGTFVLLHPSVAQDVWAWSKEGLDVGSIVGRLRRGDAS